MKPSVIVKIQKIVYYNLEHVINVKLIIARRVIEDIFDFVLDFCFLECVKEGPGEECKCEDESLCVYRPGNCFTRSYYECVPPGKSEIEPADLVFGREEAKKRNFK